MALGNVVAITRRLIYQLRRDRRTMALILIVPIVLMTLIRVSLPEERTLDYFAPAFLGTLALFFVFLLTGISFLRERSQGTMERLMASPVSRIDIVLGYFGGFSLFATAQSLIILLFTIFVLQVQYQGALWQIFVFQIIITGMALNLGIFVSTFARTEFQVVQFIPLVIIPQVLLCGVFWPIEQMPAYLQYIAKVLPLSYAVDGLKGIMLEGETLLGVGLDLGVLVAFAVVLTVLGAVALRRGAAEYR
jgi:ABC-2 type transport system permease protein